MSNDEQVILVDLDGVLVDFVGGALAVLGKSVRERRAILATWPRGVERLYDVLGMDVDEFWEEIRVRGPRFWQGLSAYPWAFHFLDRLELYGRVVICTTPSKDPASAQGKLLWIKNNLGGGWYDYVLTRDKSLLANERTILIDDFTSNVEAFRAAGGKAAYLFTQPWNAVNEEQARADKWEQVNRLIEAIQLGATR